MSTLNGASFGPQPKTWRHFSLDYSLLTIGPFCKWSNSEQLIELSTKEELKPMFKQGCNLQNGYKNRSNFKSSIMGYCIEAVDCFSVFLFGAL